MKSTRTQEDVMATGLVLFRLTTLDNPAFVLKKDDLKEFESLYGLLVELIFLPQPHERADEAFDGFYLYENFFQLGLRLPFSLFIQEVLEMYGCALGQLMPNGWRVLLGLQVLREKKKISVSPATVRFTYYPKGSFGRIQLHAHTHERHLIMNNPPREKGKTKWKRRFFILRRDLVLGTTGSRCVSTEWKAFNKVDKCEVETGAAMILKLPDEERNVEKLLDPDVLAGTSLWFGK